MISKFCTSKSVPFNVVSEKEFAERLSSLRVTVWSNLMTGFTHLVNQDMVGGRKG